MKHTSRTVAGKYLTEREYEIIQQMFLKKGRKQIADFFKTSPHTVKNQLTMLYNKFNLHTNVELVVFMLHNGFDVDGNFTQL